MTDGTKKASTFSVRLTAEERGVVELAAKRVGMKASEWARQVLLARASTKLLEAPPKQRRTKEGR